MLLSEDFSVSLVEERGNRYFSVPALSRSEGKWPRKVDQHFLHCRIILFSLAGDDLSQVSGEPSETSSMTYSMDGDEASWPGESGEGLGSVDVDKIRAQLAVSGSKQACREIRWGPIKCRLLWMAGRSSRHRGNMNLTSLPLVSVRRHGHVISFVI